MAGQVWVTDSLGGFMYADNLSNELRMQLLPTVKFRQFADARDAAHQGKSKGDTFHWNVYSKAAVRGGTLVETNTMSETNFTITQGTLTINEYGNSVPYTQKLDDLSEQPVREIINKVLSIDAKETFDQATHDQFNLTQLRVAPLNGTDTAAIVLTTNGTATTTNNTQLTSSHVKAIVDQMKERNIAPFRSDDYYAIARPTTLRTFKNNIETVHQYVDAGFQMIMNGEIGRYEGVRFVEQTNIASAAWTNSKSDWAFFFGEDTVAEAIAVPEQIRGKIPEDYGRSRGIAWYYLGGFGIVHTNALNSTIVKWDSAA